MVAYFIFFDFGSSALFKIDVVVTNEKYGHSNKYVMLIYC